MANQFDVQVPNILQAILSFDQGQKAGQDLQDRSAVRSAAPILAQGDYRNALARLLSSGGNVQPALAVAQLGNADRDYNFRTQEAQRAQGNTDRSFGLQQQQFQQGQTNADRNFGLQQQQFDEAKRQHTVSESQPKTMPFGSGLYNAKGEIIREPGASTDNGSSFDDATLTAMANQYRAGDTSVLTNLGRGAQGAADIRALRKRVAELNSAQGETGAEQANRNAEMFGVKAGQRTLGARQANIEMAAQEFQQVLPVVQKASAAVDRTQYPDLNRIIQAFNEKTGDPNIVAFGGAVNTLVNLYSRAISPTGSPTVSDKEHAREILNKAWSQGQFDAAVGMMRQEISAALNSPEKVREEMRKRFIGGQGQRSDAASGVSNGAIIQQARDAIARGADRNAVMQRLQSNDIDASGL